MADANDFLRVDFKKLLAEPDGFEVGIAPIGNGQVTAVRLRTGRGNGVREMTPDDVADFLGRFVTAIGGRLMEEFDPEAYVAGKREELVEIEGEIERLKERRHRVLKEITILGGALDRLTSLDESESTGAPRRTDRGLYGAPKRKVA